jgi:hypothetical protein
VFAYQAGLTSFAAEVEGLADYRPSEITKVYADDGKTVIGELSLERRIPLASDEIPEDDEEGDFRDRGYSLRRSHRNRSDFVFSLPPLKTFRRKLPPPPPPRARVLRNAQREPRKRRRRTLV